MKNVQVSIEACLACMVECEKCADGFLNVKDHLECVKLCRDCADICALCARLCARDSKFAEALCALCVKCCEDCANECSKHDMECCKKCAEACNNVKNNQFNTKNISICF